MVRAFCTLNRVHNLRNFKMEKIYKPYEHFNNTKHINLQEYFDEYSKELFEQQKTQESLDDKIFSALNYDGNFTREKLEELKSVCSISKLDVKGEQRQIHMENIKGAKAAVLQHQPGDIDEDSLTLETVRKVQERQQDTDKNRLLLRELRDRTLHIQDNKPEGKGLPDLKLGQDIVVSIRLFRPFAYNYRQPCTSDAIKFDQEISLLGSNTLADFRDTIKCPSDLTVMTEVSENPQEKTLQLVSAKNLYPSGFIFIDDIFYNDFRAADAIDYSEVIRKWAEDKKIGTFTTEEMNETKIISLKPRFGYPYVYQHQGRCEHVFIFSHAKLLSDTDTLYSNCYPYHSDVGGGRISFCFICGQSLPVWMVVDCDRLPQNKTPLCNDCFTSYCYEDDKKIGDFKAYPYVNRNAMF